jgi:predicted membrane protein
MQIYERIIWLAVYTAFSAYAVRLWVQWLRQRNEYGLGWRAILTIVGLCAATVSTILSVFLLVHAQFTGGYSFYHPVELFCIRYGALTALVGLVASFIGKGRVRLHLAVVSTINLLLWFMDAVAQ